MEKELFSSRSMALTALFTALLCVLAPFSLPVGPVPLSLANLVIWVSLYILGPRRAALSVLVYLLLGFCGMPVFSGFAGGAGMLAGPTGGYLAGYLPMALVSGAFVCRSGGRALPCLAGLLAGTALLYLLGTVWFCAVMHTTPAAALAVCVLPFLPGDLAKMAAAHLLGSLLRRRLEKARLM